MKEICVIGSCNMDLFYDTSRMPKQGETLIGNSFSEAYGGKGANQAIAIAKLGGKVSFIGKIGNDVYGQKLIDNFKDNNVNIDNLKTSNTNTGLAIIGRCNNDNRIVIIPGANNQVTIGFIKEVEYKILNSDIIVCQLEIPIKTVEYIAKLCREHSKIFILNPAPAQKLSKNLIESSTYIIPNEIEIMEIFEEKDIEKILQLYPEKVILTNGSKGVSYCIKNNIINISAVKVEVQDTTGAGDTFAGAFAYAISKGMEFTNAIEFANVAAALSVTKMGAQNGMPNLKQVEEIMNKRLNKSCRRKIKCQK